MRKHTTTSAAPVTRDQEAHSPALAAELDTIASRLTVAMRALSAHWEQDDMLAAEEALQAVKGAIVETMVRHYAPPPIAEAWLTSDREALPTGFPLCPILQRDSVQADLSNAWRVIDLSIDQMRGEWEPHEMRGCAAMLCGALGLLKVAAHRIESADTEANAVSPEPATSPAVDAPPLSDRERQEERDRQARASWLAMHAAGASEAPEPTAPKSSLYAASSAGRDEADRLSRASALDSMRAARSTPAPSLRFSEFSRLSCELDDASSLLTDATCAMSAGWTMAAMSRCTAMVSGAKALIDSGRARLDQAGEEVQS